MLDWFKINGDSTLRFSYPINEGSVVFDVGGYKGHWCKNIVRLYNPIVHVFEPVPRYCRRVADRFRKNSKVRVHPYGLVDKTEKQRLRLDGNASSLVRKGGRSLEVDIVDIAEFVRSRCIHRIDLIKINIEGGEYALLRRMADTGLLSICTDIQVQFHRVIPDAEGRRNEIREVLARTHSLTYDFPFVWENWRRRASKS